MIAQETTDPSAEQQEQPAQARVHHSPVKRYWVICVVLVVITAIEYFIFKVETIRGNALIMYPVLGVLSLVKFVLVVGSYMHLSDEPKSLKWIFITTVIFALFIFLILFLASPAEIRNVG